MTSHTPREPVTAIPEDIVGVAAELANATIRNYERNERANIARDTIAKAIHDAVMAEREKQAWRPIDSGPKDGTPILAADNGPYPFVVEWFVGGRNWIGADGRYWQPDCWMPLPAAPKTEG